MSTSSGPADIGRQLEEVVRLIEETILTSLPGYRKDLFTVEPRKRLNAEGVTHEIDLWVAVDHGHGYKSVFIFECRNRKRPVSKNDIIVFSEKIRALRAQAGYFVAPAFTRDARAQAAQDARINLLTVEQSTRSVLAGYLAIQFLIPGRGRTWLKVHTRDQGDITITQRAARTAVIHIGGTETRLHDYVQSWLADVIDEQHRRLADAGLHTGEYTWTRYAQRVFPLGEVAFYGYDIDKLELIVVSRTTFAEPQLRARFSVRRRGDVHFYAPVKFPGGLNLILNIARFREYENEELREHQSRRL